MHSIRRVGLFVLLAMLVAVSLIAGSGRIPQASAAVNNGGRGPGGVGLTDGSSALELWLRADQGVGLLTGEANTWTDISGNGIVFTAKSTTQRPNPTSSAGLNNQATLLFNAAAVDALTSPFNANLNTAQVTAIVVAQSTDGNSALWRTVFGSRTPGATAGYSFYDNISDSTWAFWTHSSGNYWQNNIAGTNAATGAFVLGVWDNTAINKAWSNGSYQQIGAGYVPLNAGHNCIETIGINDVCTSSPNGNFPFTGHIAEVIIYSTALNDAELILVQNYLNARYATPLRAGDDLYASTTYIIDVVGIGQDSDEELASGTQTTAKSGGLTITNNGFLANDNDFIIAGHNGTVAADSTSDLPGGVTNRWTRDWFIDTTDATSNGGSVQLIFNRTEVGGTTSAFTNPTGSVLLYRAGTSGSYSVVSGWVSSGDGNAITLTGNANTLADGYYTIGYNLQVGPTITSANNATFVEGFANTFTVTATGFPSTMTYGVTGTLPAGVMFDTATGVLSGTPAAGTTGSYPLTITAANGISPDAVQSFTLFVTKTAYVGEPLGNKSCTKMGSIVNMKLRGMIVGRSYTYTMEVRDGSFVYMSRQFTMTFAGPAGTQTNFKWIMFPVNDVPALNAPQTYWSGWTSLPASVTLRVSAVDRTTNLRTQTNMTYTCGDGVVSINPGSPTFTPNVTGAPYAP